MKRHHMKNAASGSFTLADTEKLWIHVRHRAADNSFRGQTIAVGRVGRVIKLQFEDAV